MKNRFRLKDMNITRVDLVDRGAAQDAHIVIAKSDSFQPPGGKLKPKPSNVTKPAPTAPQAPAAGGGKPPPTPNILGRAPGAGSRISRIAPQDFEVTRVQGNMMEWAIPAEKLPEGVEDAQVLMVQSGDTVTFQWMVDPLAGPPVSGEAQTAAEAFVAMRGALTQTSAFNPMDMLGGFPGQQKPFGGLAPGGGAPPAGGGGAGPKVPAASPKLKKHGGPGPHQNGTPQEAHGGGGGGRASQRERLADRIARTAMEADNPVTRALDRGFKRVMEIGDDKPKKPKVKDDGVPKDAKGRDRYVKPTDFSTWQYQYSKPPSVMASNPEAEDIAAGGTGKGGVWSDEVRIDPHGRPQYNPRYRMPDSARVKTPAVQRRIKELTERIAGSKYKDNWTQADIEQEALRSTPRSSVGKSEPVLDVESVLDLVAKGLVEVDIFVESATGSDLRDILPSDLLEELTNKLSATPSAG